MTRSSHYLPFFAYGTLLPGQPNFMVWRAAILALQPATLSPCRLYDLGDYPMLVDAPAGAVRGLLVTLARPGYERLAAYLDDLEGIDDVWGASLYRRERRVVRRANGHTAVVWVYVGQAALVAGLEPIGDDWKAYIGARD